ncbi:MAG: hypothetical protein JEZ06_01900 [Anaerolineaceae bacterium]|nr:hypothetical protein [Anaerolineaceae bacterium]
MLHKILEEFEKSNSTISLNGLAKKLDIERGALEGMLEYWVRKGRIRADDQDSSCVSCHSTSACGSCNNGMKFPKTYSLISN